MLVNSSITRYMVRRDLRAIRETLQRIRDDEQFAPLNLFGRHSPDKMLKYLDRRRQDRSSVQLPVYLTAADFNGEDITLLDENQNEQLAFTRDVSLRGIGFVHDDPIDAEFAVVKFDLMFGGSVLLLLDVRWSNVEKGFQYMSGGRFIGIIEEAACEF